MQSKAPVLWNYGQAANYLRGNHPFGSGVETANFIREQVAEGSLPVISGTLDDDPRFEADAVVALCR